MYKNYGLEPIIVQLSINTMEEVKLSVCKHTTCYNNILEARSKNYYQHIIMRCLEQGQYVKSYHKANVHPECCVILQYTIPSTFGVVSHVTAVEEVVDVLPLVAG